MPKYIDYIIQTTPFLLFGISLFAFLYSCRKSEAQKGNRYFWAGMLVFLLSTLIAQFLIHILPKSAHTLFFNVVYIACIVCGFYLMRKGIKMLKEAARECTEIHKATDISQPVGLVFGIITLPFSAIAIFAALIILIGIIANGPSPYEWPLIIAFVVFGVLSVFLSVVSYRLINVRKGWTGKLFAPYMLWLRIAGWLFLLAGLIKLIQRNLIGLWSIVIAIALIILSSKMTTKTNKEVKC